MWEPLEGLPPLAPVAEEPAAKRQRCDGAAEPGGGGAALGVGMGSTGLGACMARGGEGACGRDSQESSEATTDGESPKGSLLRPDLAHEYTTSLYGATF